MATGKTAAKSKRPAKGRGSRSAHERSHATRFIGDKCRIVKDKPRVVSRSGTVDRRLSFGLLSPFFEGLTKGKLMATRCPNKECEENRMWLPPRAHCPDCYNRMRWVEIKQPVIGRVYAYTLVDYAGIGVELKTPYWQIDVELPGLATVFKGYLSKGKPEPGDRVIARFRKGREATNSILDIYWEMYEEPKPVAKKPAAKKPVAKKATPKKPAAKKPAAKKAAAKKTVAKKPTAKKATAKRPAAKKTGVKKKK